MSKLLSQKAYKTHQLFRKRNTYTHKQIIERGTWFDFWPDSARSSTNQFKTGRKKKTGEIIKNR